MVFDDAKWYDSPIRRTSMFTDSNGERSFLQHGQNYKSAKIEAYHELHLKKIKNLELWIKTYC